MYNPLVCARDQDDGRGGVCHFVNSRSRFLSLGNYTVLFNGDCAGDVLGDIYLMASYIYLSNCYCPVLGKVNTP